MHPSQGNERSGYAAIVESTFKSKSGQPEVEQLTFVIYQHGQQACQIAMYLS